MITINVVIKVINIVKKYHIIHLFVQLKYEQKQYNGVPTARFDIIGRTTNDQKLTFLQALLRKEFTSDVTMQDVSIGF